MFDDEDDMSDSIFDDAVSRFERLVSQNISSFFDEEEFVAIASNYISSFDEEMAERAIEMGLNIYPNSFDLKFKKAEFLYTFNYIDDALSLISELELVNPNNPELYFLRGELKYFKLEHEEALNDFRKSIEYCGDDITSQLENIVSLLIDYKDYKVAIPFLEQLCELHPNDSKVFDKIALCYLSTGRLEESTEYYQKSIDIDPLNERTWGYLGEAYNMRNLNDEALEAFDYAISIDPEFVEAISGKVDVLLKMEKSEEAIEVYSELIDRNPNVALYYVGLGDLYMDLKKSRQALNSFKKAIKIDPENCEANSAMGSYLMSKHRTKEAIPFLAQAVISNNLNVEYWIVLGCAHEENSDHKKALASFLRAHTLAPNEIEPYMLVLNTYIYLQEFDKGIEFMKENEIFFHDNSRALASKALLYFLSQNKNELIETLKILGKKNIEIVKSFFMVVQSLVDDSSEVDEIRNLLKDNTDFTI